MEVFRGHANTRAVTRDTVSPAHRAVAGGGDASRGVARVVSDVSVLCPGAVDAPDNSPALGVTSTELARLYNLLCRDCGLPYPEASEHRCTAALMLEVDPVGLTGAAFAFRASTVRQRPPLRRCVVPVGCDRARLQHR